MNLLVANETRSGGDAQLPVSIWRLVATRLRSMQRGGPAAAEIEAAIAGRADMTVLRISLPREALDRVSAIVAPLPET